MVKPLALDASDHARISDAIRRAEAVTTGEIFAVFAHSSDGYLGAAGAMALGLSLLAALLSAAGLSLWGHAVPALDLVAAQGAGALVLFAVLWTVPRARLVFVPRRLQVERARAEARAQFLSHNLHTTEARTGILLFVSEAERHAEVVADAGIAAKVPQEAWDSIVNRLTEAAAAGRMADGFVEAAEAAGVLLARHFPGRPDDRNEIPDRIVEI